jgi:hypothetical protein
VIACDFVAKAEDSEGRVQVVCVRCGRSVRVNALHAGRVYANCRNQTAAIADVPQAGPGTELKKLLKTWLRIEASPNCSCNARARTMDEEEAKEPGWCAAHLDEIVGWLREEAAKRGLPFLDAAGRVLVRRAIKNARKAALTNKAT